MNFVPKITEEMRLAKAEISMWRRKSLDRTLFTDTKEEEWFTEILMNRPIGIENFEEFYDFMLKGYRKTQKEIK